MPGRPLAITQRGMTRECAAEYLSLSTAAFADWVRRGLIPGPIPGTHRWDRVAIDRALDKLSGLPTTEPSALEAWKAKRDARAA